MRRRLIVDAIGNAARSSVAHPLRASLGALAIAVAVATLVLVVTGLEGFARYARQTTARAFGTEAFVVTRVATGGVSRRELAEKLEENPVITRSDVRFLDRHAERGVIYAPIAQRRADVAFREFTFESANVNGTAAALFEIRELGVARGRFISRDDADRAVQVAVLGADIADKLFPSRDPLGQVVRIAGRGFQVVGVQERQGTAGGTSLDRYVWIPLPAFERAFGAADGLQVFGRAVPPRDNLSAASGQVDARRTQAAEDRARITMRARRRLLPGKRDTFDIITPDAARGFVERVAERTNAAAAPISAMALLAAIVVVTNTTLVSVTERTREIGVRRALGARRSDITLEVIAESCLVALAGGSVGLAASGFLLWGATAVLALDLSLRPSTAMWSLAAAAVSGLMAGLYPARRATRLDVIAAIRQE
ncbi:MAG: ABC transporter permease [Bacteroidales bacterium]